MRAKNQFKSKIPITTDTLFGINYCRVISCDIKTDSVLIYWNHNYYKNISLARTQQVIAAQRAIRNHKKRNSSEVATLKDENKAEEVSHKLLILNQDLAKIPKKNNKHTN